MTPGTQTTLRVTRRIAAPRERVWRAWTDPRELERWWGPVQFSVRTVRMDLRPGGDWRIEMEPPEGPTIFCVGTFREVAPPERIVTTFLWEPMAIGETIVTVEFRDADGATEVVITHDLQPSAEVRAFHDWGWRVSLARLADRLSG